MNSYFRTARLCISVGSLLLATTSLASAQLVQSAERSIKAPTGGNAFRSEAEGGEPQAATAAAASGTDNSSLRLGGFVVGSYSYNSRIQMVPEFAGGAQALTAAGQTNFR